MNNSIKFYDNNNIDSAREFGIQTSSYSNYEYEMVNSVSNAASSPVDAIEIIVDMAKTGKIDPWNIDIVKVHDEYMKKLRELKKNENLGLVGKAFFFSSVLLNLKSKVLNGISLQDFEPDPEFDEDFNDYEDGYEPEQLQLPSSNIISFDEVLQRRTSTKLNRNRGVTLNDLIRHLEFYEQLEKKRALKENLERQKKRFGRNYSKMSTTEILDMTQDEYIEELVNKMEQNLNKILETNDKIELEELSLIGFSRPAAYIAVLYLASYGKFDIYQEEFYGDLFVKLPEKTTDLPEIKTEKQSTVKAAKTLKNKLEKDKASLENGEIENAC